MSSQLLDHTNLQNDELNLAKNVYVYDLSANDDLIAHCNACNGTHSVLHNAPCAKPEMLIVFSLPFITVCPDCGAKKCEIFWNRREGVFEDTLFNDYKAIRFTTQGIFSTNQPPLVHSLNN